MFIAACSVYGRRELPLRKLDQVTR
jgi:hypothetical protein